MIFLIFYGNEMFPDMDLQQAVAVAGSETVKIFAMVSFKNLPCLINAWQTVSQNHTFPATRHYVFAIVSFALQDDSIWQIQSNLKVKPKENEDEQTPSIKCSTDARKDRQRNHSKLFPNFPR